MFVLFQYPGVHDVERFTLGDMYLKHHHSMEYWGHGAERIGIYGKFEDKMGNLP